MKGIYIVDISEDRERRTRVVLTADSAAEAEKRAVGFALGADAETTGADVGRLGDFDPGIEGAGMAHGSVIAIQRIGQR